MPPQISHLKHQPVRLGTKEKASLLPKNLGYLKFSLVRADAYSTPKGGSTLYLALKLCVQLFGQQPVTECDGDG